MVLNLIVSMLSARFLGPSNYGLISYAGSIVAFVLPIMFLGLKATLVQELKENPDKEGMVMGTSLGLTVPASLLSMIAVVGFVFLVDHDENTTIIVCAIYSVSLLFQATEVVSFWFQSRLLSKYPAVLKILACVIVSVYKITILVQQKSVFWFAAVNAIDHFLISIFLLVSFFVVGKQKLSFSFDFAKKMLSKSKYYILSGVLVMVFQQTDRLMLKNMSNTEMTGFYTVAVACVNIFGFVYIAIVDSFRPIVLESRNKSIEEYENLLIKLYSLIFYISLMQGLATTIVAKPMIYLMYGTEYLPAVMPLQIVVWYVAYSYMGSVRNIWILGENKHKLIVLIDITGAVMNVVLNLILIPKFAAVGAAVASLVTQFFINFVLGFIIPSLRPNNRLLLKGMNPKYAFLQVKSMLKKKKLDT